MKFLDNKYFRLLICSAIYVALIIICLGFVDQDESMIVFITLSYIIFIPFAFCYIFFEEDFIEYKNFRKYRWYFPIVYFPVAILAAPLAALFCYLIFYFYYNLAIFLKYGLDWLLNAMQTMS